MEIFDSVHGYIKIDDYIKDIIDTVEFQRLRNIKQLGCCYYVFPGASHNRFEHSLGVYYLTKRYIKHLNRDDIYINEYETKMLCIAAIIHDLGHGPYSHLFDDIVDHSKFHEYRSIEIFKTMNEIHNYGYSEGDISFIYEIIKPTKDTYDKKYLYQIVSNKNGIDVDRFDYLIRDIQMIGLNYGIEYDRIMKKSKIMNGEIIYSNKIKEHIEDFYRIRYLMYKEVYNHSTVRSIEFMIKELLENIDNYYRIKDIVSNNQWNDFILLNDSIIDIMNHMEVNENIYKLFSLIQRIKTRNIYKPIGHIITDSHMNIPSHSDHIIIDEFKITYYSSEPCKFYSEKNIINLMNHNQHTTEYNMAIFYKHDIYRDEAQLIYDQIIGDVKKK
jgi:deoxynucleoside triphosphate triphosphohydrolase SAMHD1